MVLFCFEVILTIFFGHFLFLAKNAKKCQKGLHWPQIKKIRSLLQFELKKVLEIKMVLLFKFEANLTHLKAFFYFSIFLLFSLQCEMKSVALMLILGNQIPKM